jgi:hypothetical protein
MRGLAAKPARELSRPEHRECHLLELRRRAGRGKGCRGPAIAPCYPKRAMSMHHLRAVEMAKDQTREIAQLDRWLKGRK